ncbi:uncharacterized protein L199_006794 [Kwoniella botswanensis]|uniref:uncharacterized protein n=1 Tax=Kwoniella botswanensis TaxID=1268659 RepID=UPI00315DFFE8
MERLDDFLVELALRKLPLKDLLACSATCKRFNGIITSSSKIQLFLHNHLFGRSSPPTTDRLEDPPKAIKDRSTTDRLARLLRMEDNLLRLRPHLRSYELPANQSICTIGHGYIVTSCPSGAEIEPDKDGLYTLVTIWIPDDQSKEGKLDSRAIKVDFKPNTESKTRAVDVMDDVIVCVQELDAGGDTVFRVRVLHLFNEGEIAKPWDSDEITKTTQDMGLDNAPRVMIGREGLLVVITPFSIKWTRWTEGRDCTWGHIQVSPYLGFSSSIRVYGSDILGVLGQCVPPLSDNPFAPPPVPKDHLLIYHLNDKARDVVTKPVSILRMPYGRNEFSERVRAAVPHEKTEEVVFPGMLTTSNNGRSSILQVGMTTLDASEGGGMPHLDDYPPWITIDIPLKAIRDLSGIDEEGGHKPRPTGNFARYPADRQTNNYTSSRPVDEHFQKQRRRCECCIAANEKVEQLGDIEVIPPHNWEAKSLMSFDRISRSMHEFPRIFGTRTLSQYVNFQDFQRTEGKVLLELTCRNYKVETGYEVGKHKSLGGLGKPLRLPEGPKEIGRLRPGHFSTYINPDTQVVPFTHYRGHWKTLPARGLMVNILFDGEKVIYEYQGGYVTVLDFTSPS